MTDVGLKERVYTETELRARAIYFDRMDRRSFTFPQVNSLSFDLLTLTERELNGGVITGIGLDSPQWDFFGDGPYVFQLQRVQPPNLTVKEQDGNLTTAEIQRYNFRGIGSTENPLSVYIPLKQRYVWSIIIQGLAGGPGTGFRVVNLFIRTRGYLFR